MYNILCQEANGSWSVIKAENLDQARTIRNIFLCLYDECIIEYPLGDL